ncbi:MAG: ABC transporter ATP-binding protein [Actinobacteria bacterium]|nr:ABC transporter ATP-binding protein [Actinomycetota bacterium]
MTRVLVAEGVRKRYGALVALDDVDLEIAAGEVLALLGPNGAGKTTLVSIVAGLRRADAGRVEVAGCDVARDPHGARLRLGLAPQELGVYPTLSVRDNLRFHGELAGLRGAELRRRIAEAAQALALERLLARAARTLSGGEARRLHTAMSVMGRPALLLLDEPTAGADLDMRAQLLALVRALAAEGTGVCYSTHYLHEVERLGASVAIIDAGRIAARGSLDALVGRYGRAGVELRFDGPPPPLDGDRVSDTSVRVATREAPAEAAARILARLGAETRRLRAVELIEPSLESVFLDVTGRRFSVNGHHAGGGEDDDGGA